MFDALYISATGMQAQQTNVDAIANNLANVNTTGFKRSKVAFTDLVVQQSLRGAATGAPEGLVAGAGRIAAGVGVAGIAKIFEMGELKKTESALDLAIQGDGFVEVQMPDATNAYLRGGTLKISRDGVLSTASGYPLKPNLVVPDNATNLSIEADGRVLVQSPDQSQPIELGRIDLVRFSNPSGLLAQGDGLYRASETSGEAILARAAEDGMGTFAQGFLEGSNVKLNEEMVNLMVAQRVYEANAKVIQASDEMLGMVNGLRR